jgi:hypothetical protein
LTPQGRNTQKLKPCATVDRKKSTFVSVVSAVFFEKVLEASHKGETEKLPFRKVTSRQPP